MLSELVCTGQRKTIIPIDALMEGPKARHKSMQPSHRTAKGHNTIISDHICYIGRCSMHRHVANTSVSTVSTTMKDISNCSCGSVCMPKLSPWPPTPSPQGTSRPSQTVFSGWGRGRGLQGCESARHPASCSTPAGQQTLAPPLHHHHLACQLHLKHLLHHITNFFLESTPALS